MLLATLVPKGFQELWQQTRNLGTDSGLHPEGDLIRSCCWIALRGTRNAINWGPESGRCPCVKNLFQMKNIITVIGCFPRVEVMILCRRLPHLHLLILLRAEKTLRPCLLLISWLSLCLRNIHCVRVRRNLWETRNEEGGFSGRDVRRWSLGSPRNLSTWFCGWTPTASTDAVRLSRGGTKPRAHTSYRLPDQEPVSKSTSTFLRSESESAGELRIELWHLRELRIEPLAPARLWPTC